MANNIDADKAAEDAAEKYSTSFLRSEEKWNEDDEIEYNKRRSAFLAGASWQSSQSPPDVCRAALEKIKISINQNNFKWNEKHNELTSVIEEALSTKPSVEQDELWELRRFVIEVSNGQRGELKGEFILRITKLAKLIIQRNSE